VPAAPSCTSIEVEELASGITGDTVSKAPSCTSIEVEEVGTIERDFTVFAISFSLPI
jgi:hypothetical protein